MALKAASLFGWSLSIPVLISYAIRIPCNSSIVILVKSLVSSMTETLASYFKRSDLNTFCTTKDSVDTERGVNQYQVQFKNLFQLILKPFNYIQ
jgi:hypothetical protein